MRVVLLCALLIATAHAAEKQNSLGQPSVGWGAGSRSDEELSKLKTAEEMKARFEALRRLNPSAPGGDQIQKPVDTNAVLEVPPQPQEGSPMDTNPGLVGAVGAMNITNPFADGFAGDAIKQKLSEKMGLSRSTIDWVTGLKVWPRIFDLVRSPQFLSDAVTVSKSPRRAAWMWAQIVWVLLCVMLTWWRMDVLRDRGFFRRLSERAMVWCVFVAGSLVVVPWALFGNPWYRIIAGATGALLGA